MSVTKNCEFDSVGGSTIVTSSTQTVDVPLDVDSIPCFIGDTVYDNRSDYPTLDEEGALVTGIDPMNHDVLVVYRKSKSTYCAIPAIDVTHDSNKHDSNEDSWEQLTLDMALMIANSCDYAQEKFGEDLRAYKLCAECNDNDRCKTLLAMDFVRRAKELAGITTEEDDFYETEDDLCEVENDLCEAENEMNGFEYAIRLVKRGYRMKRRGWNGKDQYIELATNVSFVNPDSEVVNVDHTEMGNKAIAFHGTSGVQLGWLASQADMLAEDWVEVDDENC